MRTGVSYMGHHNPRHMARDLGELEQLGCDDVLLAAQENDFQWMTGKIEHLPRLARDHGQRPIAIFWGVLNLFGGGRSSQFLLEHPEGHQIHADGSWNPRGCYNNPVCVQHIETMLDRIIDLEYEGYFIDEPKQLRCYCSSCRQKYGDWYGGDLASVPEDQQHEFRRRCAVDYVRKITDYVHHQKPTMHTMCCLQPVERELWEPAGELENLDDLGTDIYWVNNDRDVEEMTPLIRELASICRRQGKQHHEWLQCWKSEAGREHRILDQGRVFVREQPDALYAWAYHAQIGTVETAADPDLAWQRAREVLRLAKEEG